MPADLVSGSTTALEQGWKEIVSLGEHGALTNWLDDPELIEAVRQAINSTAKTYRYVLPTQLVAKVVDASLDCRCLQAGRGGAGAFDARTVAHKVIVPFDQANERVLGGSPEPYVNNPLRIPELSRQYASDKKNSRDWERLCYVLDAVEAKQDPSFTKAVLWQALTEVYRRLADVRVTYPVPSRISLGRCLRLIEDYLGQLSGGDRLLALTSALFVVIGRRFQLYSSVRRATITTADQATGMLADLEAVSEDGKIVLTVEVKDRTLTISQIKGKIANVDEKQISEVFFVAQQGISGGDVVEVQSLIDSEFVAGHNIYLTDLLALARVALALLGEPGRHDFLVEVGNQLEVYRSDIQHRRAWAELLRAI